MSRKSWPNKFESQIVTRKKENLVEIRAKLIKTKKGWSIEIQWVFKKESSKCKKLTAIKKHVKTKTKTWLKKCP